MKSRRAANTDSTGFVQILQIYASVDLLLSTTPGSCLMLLYCMYDHCICLPLQELALPSGCPFVVELVRLFFAIFSLWGAYLPDLGYLIQFPVPEEETSSSQVLDSLYHTTAESLTHASDSLGTEVLAPASERRIQLGMEECVHNAENLKDRCIQKCADTVLLMPGGIFARRPFSVG